MDDRRLPRAARRFEGFREILCSLDRRPEAAKGACIGREIWILQVCRDYASRKIALLMHPDRTIAPIVAHDNDDRQGILHGGREFLSVHQEVAVAIN